MNQIFRGCQAKLCVFLVVSRIGEVVSVADPDQTRIFDAAVFFVVGFRREHGIGTTVELCAVDTFSVAETRGAGMILCAVEHDEFAAMKDDGRIKGAGRLPG